MIERTHIPLVSVSLVFFVFYFSRSRKEYRQDRSSIFLFVVIGTTMMRLSLFDHRRSVLLAIVFLLFVNKFQFTNRTYPWPLFLIEVHDDDDVATLVPCLLLVLFSLSLSPSPSLLLHFHLTLDVQTFEKRQKIANSSFQCPEDV